MANAPGCQIFGSYGNPDHLKVLLALSISKLEGKTVDVDYNPQENVSFLLKKKRPYLQVKPGFVLFSSNEICRYLLESSPRGKPHLSPKHDDTWLEWERVKLKPAVRDSFKEEQPSVDLLNCLESVESILMKTGRYFIGTNTCGLVDMVIWSTLYPVLAKESSLSSVTRSKCPKVADWFEDLLVDKQFAQAVTKVTASCGFTPFQVYFKGDIFMVRPATPPPGADPPTSPEEVLAVEQADIEEAVAAWNRDPAEAPKPRILEHPILPVEGERNILITSALPYVNNVPHLGNIIGCVLSADVYARFCRLRNYNTLYICGTDEYGTATETKAMQEGVSPQELCRKYNALHKEVYDWFNIKFDHFGRTSTTEQTEICQDIFWRLHKRGFISADTVEQLFCENCQRFLADRFVEGICPFCAYEDARGDQCDKCGKLINAVELKNPRCKTCAKQPHIKSSSHLFLDLSKLESAVSDWSEKSVEEGYWTNNARVITSSWLRDGLRPRCITRDLKWGTPVPLEGYTNKVFYVWFDAPIGYISITAEYTKDWKTWWKNPDRVQLVQFMAKDNVPFHTVVFPATLIGTDDNYTLLNVMSATEYLNYEDGKFSKSRGVGVFGNNAKDSGIPADIFRFYLLYIRPENQDTAFSWDDLMLKNNTELLNNLGNFINRSLMFLKNNFGSTVPEMPLCPETQQLLAVVTKELRAYIRTLDELKLRDGLKYILNISRHGNGYLQSSKPWKLIKGNEEERRRAGTVIGVSANIACLLSVLLQPYMPQVSQTLQEQLQVPAECNVLCQHVYMFLQPGHKIGVPSPLFSKIEINLQQSLRAKYGGTTAK